MAKGQKKQKQTPEVLSKLEQAFAIGATNEEACFFAGIAPATLYTWHNADEALSERHKALKNKPVLQARKVVIDAMQNGDAGTAKWYLERQRREEFSTRTESDVNVAGLEIVGDILSKK